MAILISPMIVPLIISAAGMYFFYSRIGLQGTYWGVVLAHAITRHPLRHHHRHRDAGRLRPLADARRREPRRGAVRTFFKVQMPLILPGVISGGLFAFITSFDEVVVVMFVGGPAQQTLPWQMFTGLREQISPTILAVATVLVALSVLLLATLEVLDAALAYSSGLMVPLALATAALIVVIPILRALCIAWTVLPLRLGRRPLPGARTAFRLAGQLKPWSMAEVFIIGVVVALVKVAGIATLDLGPAFWAMAALVLTVVLEGATLCEWSLWQTLERMDRS
jgi:hypothetical protein